MNVNNCVPLLGKVLVRQKRKNVNDHWVLFIDH